MILGMLMVSMQRIWGLGTVLLLMGSFGILLLRNLLILFCFLCKIFIYASLFRVNFWARCSEGRGRRCFGILLLAADLILLLIMYLCNGLLGLR